VEYGDITLGPLILYVGLFLISDSSYNRCRYQ
jgi:hypothetical protein